MRSTTAVVALALTLSAFGVAPAESQQSRAEAAATARPEVLVLGVYHMANPRRDIFNTEADDVLAPRRQAEIAHVIEALKQFRPSKIAVEREPGDDRIRKDYADYLAGTHQLTRNEIEQLGFRLAKELGHKTVYGVDTDGEFPYLRLIKYAKATGRSNEFEALNGQIGDMVKANTAYLASHTVLATLLYLNSDEKVAEAVGFYYRQAEYGEPYDWAGADLVSDWFRRNMRIYSNVVQIADSPNERVLVIYGHGHLGWLRHAFASNPKFRLRKLAEFVK